MSNNPSYPNVAYGGIEFIVVQTIPLCLKKLQSEKILVHKTRSPNVITLIPAHFVENGVPNIYPMFLLRIVSCIFITTSGFVSERNALLSS